jgi:threonine dehydratase
VFLKLETLQPTFSFKIRGALNAVMRLGESAQDRSSRVSGLVTASAGNHGRAMAHAARGAGIPLTVYVSEGAPRVKREAIRAAGARLELCHDYDEAERRAKAHGASGRALYISPYAHPDVIAGAGTVGVEILQDRPDVDTIVVPVGGGGLISGIAIAAKESARPVTIVGVEVEASSPFTASLAAGTLTEINVRETLADGLAGNLDSDTPTFDIVRRLVDRLVLAEEADLRRTIAAMAVDERIIVEGAGAAAVAAVQHRKIDLSGRTVAIVVSGANIDLEKFAGILSAES